jgi:ATP-binding cassette subfamily C protein LapB
MAMRALFPPLRHAAPLFVTALLANICAIFASFFPTLIYDHVLPQQNWSTLWTLTVAVTGFLVLDYCIRWSRAGITEYLSQGYDEEVSLQSFAGLADMKMTGISSSRLISQVRELDPLREVRGSLTMGLMVDFPFSLVMIAILAMISPWLAALTAALSVLVVVIIAVSWWMQDGLSKSAQKTALARQDMLIDFVSGMDSIRRLSLGARYAAKFTALVKKHAEQSSRLRFIQAISSSHVQEIQQIASIATVIVSSVLVFGGGLASSAMIAASLLAGKAIGTLYSSASALPKFVAAIRSLKMAEEIAAMPRESGGDLVLRRVGPKSRDSSIRFQNVVFGYSSRHILDDVNFTVRKGDRFVVVGPNGSGKSTIERLMVGLETPKSGGVFIDGLDTRVVLLSDLRLKVLSVGQSGDFPFVTMREAFPDTERAAAYLEACGSVGRAVLSEAGQGFDRSLGVRGSALSSGQRQLIMLVAALVRDPDFLILDEATAHLDPTTQAMVSKLLGDYANEFGIGLFLITHDPSLVTICNWYMTVKQGNVEVKQLEQRPALGGESLVLGRTG